MLSIKMQKQKEEKMEKKEVESMFATTFKAAANTVCDYCRRTENYWLTDCEGEDTAMFTCPVAKLLAGLEEEEE